jgi:hypothetical protein
LIDIELLPDDLKLAVLKQAASYYEQREAVAFGASMVAVLSNTVTCAGLFICRTRV